MKVAIAQSNLTLRGGAERVLLKIAQHYRAPIYVSEYSREGTFEQFADMDVRVISVRGLSSVLPYGRMSQGLNYGLGFYGLNLKDEFDVINAHMAPSHWIVNKNRRTLWYCHTPLRDIYDLYDYRMAMRKPHTRPLYVAGAAAVRSIDQRVVKKLRYIVANSRNVKDRIARYYSRNDAKVLGGGVEYKEYRNRGDDKYFFYPSRVSPNKRQEYAIEAFRRFSTKFKGYKLIVAGAVSKDGLYRDYYERVLRMSKTVAGVEFIESRTDAEILDLYSRCTAVLYPPINEDYGLVPLEAMASGKPVIAVNEGGPRDTIRNNKTGVLVDSPEGMANAMERVVRDKEFAAKLGKNGRKEVESNYSWKRFFKEFDRYLKLTAKL